MQDSCNRFTSVKYELDFYDLIMAFDLIDVLLIRWIFLISVIQYYKKMLYNDVCPFIKFTPFVFKKNES